MREENIFVTRRGLAKLRGELADLERELAEVSHGKADAAEVGGNVWHDNPAFDAIELKQRTLMKHIAELRVRLHRAVIIEDASEHMVGKGATIGSIVEVEFEDGKRITFRIGDYTEADPSSGVISYQSPLGGAVLGANPGDKREYHIEDRAFKLTVKSVKKGKA